MTRDLAPLARAYATTEAITRREARNFFYGIRLLPPAKRSALCAVYALARRIDDIGDGAWPTAEKLAALGAMRTSLRAIAAGVPAGAHPYRPGMADSGDPVLAAIADTARRFPVPLGAFEELVDGVEMDVRADAAPGSRPYRTFDDLVGYCRCVAGSVGRLCLGVFGSRPNPDAARYADALGIALQQTNILRDIREDLQHGRVYLPVDELDRFGVRLELDEHGWLDDVDGRLAGYIAFCADRAREWYADGMRLVPLLDRRSAACATAMSGIYRRLLDDIAADPPSVYRARRSLTTWRKAGVAARALAGRTRS